MAEQDIIPAGSTARLQMGGPMEGVRNFMAQPAVARSLPIIGLLAALAITAAAWLTFNVPPQRPLFEGLQETDKAAVASSLQSAGIKATETAANGGLSALKLRLEREQKDIDTDRTRVDEREAAYKARLLRNMSGMDSRVANLRATQSYLQQQIDQWNNN